MGNLDTVDLYETACNEFFDLGNERIGFEQTHHLSTGMWNLGCAPETRPATGLELVLGTLAHCVEGLDETVVVAPAVVEIVKSDEELATSFVKYAERFLALSSSR